MAHGGEAGQAAAFGLEGVDRQCCGPRLPSNSVRACSWISFFHWLTCTGWTPYSCPIWLIVFTHRTASSPTFALNSGRCTLRFLVSLMIYPFLSTVAHLNCCLKSRVHFTRGQIGVAPTGAGVPGAIRARATGRQPGSL
jgi:hypothetical protein